MNEIFDGFVTQPYFSKYIILKRARKSQQYLYLYRIRFMPTIIQGIMIFMNEFDFQQLLNILGHIHVRASLK